MPHAQGQVEAISAKVMPEPDKFGNTHRYSVKIGEDWYSFGQGKRDTISLKDGSNWVELTKGTTVEFMYTLNGDFRNVKRGDVKLVGAPAPASQAAPRQASASTYDGGSGIAIGHAINNATSLITSKVIKPEGGDVYGSIEAVAWEIVAMSKRMAGKYGDFVSSLEKKSAPAETAQPDDPDVPF